jgi:heparin binding hemagglutinin HbhA
MDMAKTTPKNKQTQQLKVDPTRPFYAAVGSVDIAVAAARTGLTDVQSRLSRVDLEPKVLAEQGRTLVITRVDALQKQAKTLPARAEAKFSEYVAELGETVEDLNVQYADLATRGRQLVGRIRRQQATQELKAETRKTVSKAKTTTSQTRKTADTAKRSAKATRTSAQKTAASATKATRAAAAKTGN